MAEAIQFIGTLNEHKQVIKAYGDGASEITLTADATQLGPVLASLVKLHNKQIQVTLEPLPTFDAGAKNESIPQRGEYKG